MALAAAPTRQRGPVRSTVTVDQWDEAQLEVQALRNELRALGRLSPQASAIHRYVASMGESIEAEQMSAAVAAYLARAARRHP
jgi:hypothetical protein